MIGLDSSESTEAKRKISVKGCLKKADLHEAYNCEKKSAKRLFLARKKSKGDNSGVDMVQSIPVKAVEFKEAVIEEVLSGRAGHSLSPNNPDAVNCRKLSREEKLYQCVRKISQSNYLESSSNGSDANNNRYNKAASPTTASHIGITVTPVGYEPENSLRRRHSSVDGLKQLSAPRPARRTSANVVTSPISTPTTPPAVIPPTVDESKEPATTSSEYEPENSLRRVRKTSDTNTSNAPVGRQRRSGLAMLSSATSNHLDTEKIQSRRVSAPSYLDLRQNAAVTPESNGIERTKPTALVSPNSPKMPLRPQLQKQNSLFTLSIQENTDTISLYSNSPKPPRRKVSTGLRRVVSGTDLVASAPSPHTTRRSQLVSPTSSSPRLSKSATLSDRLSATSTFSLTSTSTASEVSCASRRQQSKTAGVSHLNAGRYWDWYILNASYSWKNFNTDKFLCY